MSDIRIPPATTSSRADELWKHTCFEAFLRFEEEGYSEFNFAPSAQWAAYTFRGYREAMKPITGLASPKIATASTDISFELRATLAVDPLTALRLGLSAIIEETNGRKSYWALAHPPGKPDFHHPDCFALDLPPASPA